MFSDFIFSIDVQYLRSNFLKFDRFYLWLKLEQYVVKKMPFISTGVDRPAYRFTVQKYPIQKVDQIWHTTTYWLACFWNLIISSSKYRELFEFASYLISGILFYSSEWQLYIDIVFKWFFKELNRNKYGSNVLLTPDVLVCFEIVLMMLEDFWSSFYCSLKKVYF